ncbi:DUF1330 domain-containing protein [Rhodobacteraceae bacterium NNCM2]|nr:DUF1330 domain-containing protein [Coraliihabitans acroporae]
MSCYSIIAVTPTSEDWIPGYLGPANKLVAKHGGTYRARTTAHEQIEGAADPATLRIVIEWPSREAAHAFMNDPDYAEHLANRTAGSKSIHFLVDAKDDLAA